MRPVSLRRTEGEWLGGTLVDFGESSFSDALEDFEILHADPGVAFVGEEAWREGEGWAYERRGARAHRRT